MPLSGRSTKYDSKVNTAYAAYQQQMLDEITRGVGHCLSTESGIALFNKVMDICGFHRPSVTANPTTGEFFKDSTMFYEGQRSVWLQLRQIIPRDKLILIENPEMMEPPKEDEDNERNGTEP